MQQKMIFLLISLKITYFVIFDCTCVDDTVVGKQLKSVLAAWIFGFLEENGTKMNNRKHSASHGSRNDAPPPPPQPPPKCQTSRQGGPSCVEV